jgi:hypothetical protein
MEQGLQTLDQVGQEVFMLIKIHRDKDLQTLEFMGILVFIQGLHYPTRKVMEKVRFSQHPKV